MIAVLKQTWALMLGMLILMAGNGLQGTLIGVRGSMEEFSTSAMGLVMSAYFIGFLGGSQITPKLIKRVGHVRVFAALGSLVSAAYIAFSWFVDPMSWWGLRLVVGFCASGIYVVAESWINDSTTSETRGGALSMYTFTQMSGIVVGQMLLNIADPGGYHLFILISVMVSLSFTPILLSTSKVPVFETSNPMSLKELIKASPLGCVGIFLLGGIFSALFGMSAIFAAKQGFSVAEISYFTMSIYLGGMLFQFPIGWVADRFDRRLLIMGVTGGAALCAFIAAQLDGSFIPLLVLAFFVGGTANSLYPLLLAYTNDRLSYEQMSAASGGLIFINGIGAIGGPIVVGFAMSALGQLGYFYYIGILSLLICVFSMYRSTQSDSVPAEENTPYIPLYGSSTQVASEAAIEAMEEQILEIEEGSGETVD